MNYFVYTFTINHKVLFAASVSTVSVMPEQEAFKQVDDKHVAIEGELMVWSPKFDLVALSNVQGEVS